MPISESDYSYDDATNDHYDLDHRHYDPPSSTSGVAPNDRMMSKAELRKTHKPIMEKRRRAKINNCLNEIKDLLLAAMKKDPERHSKLEKADILEMAVKHLKSVQKQQKEVAMRADPGLAMKYKSGYLECASEVSSFVDQIEGVDAGLKQRLSNHLSRCADGVERPRRDFASSSLLASFAAQSRFNQTDDQNNNGRGLPTMRGIELIPSCLPNGDLAFLVPKSSFSSILNSQPGMSQFNLDGVAAKGVEKEASTNSAEPRPSAFVTVMPRPQNGLLTLAKPLSPPMSPDTPKVSVIRPRAEKPAPLGLSAPMPKSDKIRSIKFPINTTAARKEHEPLCIITNVGERHRQAQQVEETRHLEENRYYGQTHPNRSQHQPLMPSNLKRKADHSEGLLALAQVKHPRMEIPEDGPAASAFRSVARDERFDHFAGKFDRETIYECISDDDSDDDDAAEKGPEDEDRNEPMWRPW